MTNIIVLSSILVTNWTGWTTFQPTNAPSTNLYVFFGNFIEHADVYRQTKLGYKEGTNLVYIGSLFNQVGTVNKTNNIPGPLIKNKEDDFTWFNHDK